MKLKKCKFKLIVLLVISSAVLSCQTNKESENMLDSEILLTNSPENSLKMLYMGEDMELLFTEQLENGAIDVNWTDESGSTFLHHAVWLGKEDIAQELIVLGADVNAQRTDGFTPLHWSAYRGHIEITSLLLDNGAEINSLTPGTTPLFWAISREKNKLAIILLNSGANMELSLVDGLSPLELISTKYGLDTDSLYSEYNNSAFVAYLDDDKAFTTGVPSKPPYPQSIIKVENRTVYMDKTVITIAVENTGQDDMFNLVADFKVNGYSERDTKIFFGRVPPGETVTRIELVNSFDYSDIGANILISITFSEDNGYIPENLNGMITVVAPDADYLLENIIKIDANTIKKFVDSKFVILKDVSNAVIESFNKNSFDTNALIIELRKLNLITLPEILYSYTISDGGSSDSRGNQDGIIQLGENIDFNFIINNHSPFDLEDIAIDLSTKEGDIDVFNSVETIELLPKGNTYTFSRTIAFKRGFEGDKLPLDISIKNSLFEELISEQLIIPVGGVTGSSVVPLDLQATAVKNITVKGGASYNSPQIATLSEGAIFSVIGELDNWYKIAIYVKLGSGVKSNIEGFILKTDSIFLVDSGSGAEIDDSILNSENHSMLTFENSKNNSEVK